MTTQDKLDALFNILRTYREGGGMDVSGTLKEKIGKLRQELLQNKEHDKKIVIHKICEEYLKLYKKRTFQRNQDAEVLLMTLVVALEK